MLMSGLVFGWVCNVSNVQSEVCSVHCTDVWLGAVLGVCLGVQCVQCAISAMCNVQCADVWLGV